MKILFKSFSDKIWRGGALVVLCGAAILFNPIIPFNFSRGTWMILDMITGILMLCCGCVYFLNFGD